MNKKKKAVKTETKKPSKKGEKFKLDMNFEDAIALSIKTKMPKKNK